MTGSLLLECDSACKHSCTGPGNEACVDCASGYWNDSGACKGIIYCIISYPPSHPLFSQILMSVKMIQLSVKMVLTVIIHRVASYVKVSQSLSAVICSALTPSLPLQIVIECVMVRVQGVVPVGVSRARTGIRWRMEDVKVCGS